MVRVLVLSIGMPPLGRTETRGTGSIRCRRSWRMSQRWPSIANTSKASIQAEPSLMHRRGPPPEGSRKISAAVP